ncbi:MAG: RsmE family RNA methyltransferase [Cytophagales bacterium]|nr:16S rRNA (uracil(1498)-N(3))-methyltransferase [Bernardetiaceae bacterium]MDW8210715.1 RsmE family RNA methyltransferase [Cytophagales bacterium]
MQLFYVPELEKECVLSEEESAHCLRVLRMQKGDTLYLTDGKGCLAESIISQANAKGCRATILRRQWQPPPSGANIHLAVAPVKNAERIEWMLEKCVEMGIGQISFVVTGRTERTRLNLERLQKKAIAAMKQSLHCWLPQITPPMEFPTFLQTLSQTMRFIAHADAHKPSSHLFELAKPTTSACVLIGPEGDFTSEELAMAQANGFQIAGLGNTRLRTETAAILACHTLVLLNELSPKEV